jgi:arylsulfatase A-like enzyme
MNDNNNLTTSLARQSISVVMVLLAISGSSAGAEAVVNEKPNVVLIYIDDLGYGDLGAYGGTDIPTPNIDRLAKEGVRCTASYITNPPCCPSRCSLMMGQYTQRFGKYGMSRGLPIPQDRPTLAEFLRDHGYVTGQIGKWDIGTKRQGPLASGFMEVAKNPPRKQYTEEEIAGASKELRRQLADKKGESKYFCVNEDGETVWLTDCNGDSMVEFIDRHKTGPFFLYWSPDAVHSFNTEVPERLTKRTQAQGKRRKLPARSLLSMIRSASCCRRWTNRVYAKIPWSSSPVITAPIQATVERRLRMLGERVREPKRKAGFVCRRSFQCQVCFPKEKHTTA